MDKSLFDRCYVIGPYGTFKMNPNVGKKMYKSIKVLDMHKRLKEVHGTVYPFYDISSDAKNDTDIGLKLFEWIRSTFKQEIEAGTLVATNPNNTNAFSGFKPLD